MKSGSFKSCHTQKKKFMELSIVIPRSFPLLMTDSSDLISLWVVMGFHALIFITVPLVKINCICNLADKSIEIQVSHPLKLLVHKTAFKIC